MFYFSSGASPAQLTRLDIVLTNVAKMEEAKPSKQLQTLYSKKDKEEAEAERSTALEAVSDSSEDEEDDSDDYDYEADKKKKAMEKKKGPQKCDPKMLLVKHLQTKSEVIH